MVTTFRWKHIQGIAELFGIRKLACKGFCLHQNVNLLSTQALIQQEKDLTQQIKNLQIQIQQTVPDKNHLKQLEHKVKELEKGSHDHMFFLFLPIESRVLC